MDICHGVWEPPQGHEFDNPGRFLFWVETSVRPRGERPPHMHPACMPASGLVGYLGSDLKLPKAVQSAADVFGCEFNALLPTEDGQPLPSLEMAQLTGEYLPDTCSWNKWTIDAVTIAKPMLFLRELEFMFGYGVSGIHPGHDLQFWMRFARHLRNMVKQHQFLPVFKSPRAGRGQGSSAVTAGWAPVARNYEQGLQAFAEAMPAVCAAKPRDGAKNAPPACMDRVAVLRHFSERQMDILVADTPFTKTFLNQIKDSWLPAALGMAPELGRGGAIRPTADDIRQWKAWHDKIVGRPLEAGFVPGVRLEEVSRSGRGDWRLRFFVSSGRDPSLRIDLEEWWALSDARKAYWLKEFGGHFERDLLVGLGHAARMCPLLWQGMESAQPTGLKIDLDTAYEFLRNDALILESAGFRIVLPSWWTPKGRRRARIRIKAAGRSSASEQTPSAGFFNLDRLASYRYHLSVGGETVSAQEWQALVNAKSPLVRFRGEWMEIDSGQLNIMLDMWRQKDTGADPVEIDQLLKDIAESDENEIEFELDEVLSATLEGLQNQESIKPENDPAGLRGQLRTYQKRGLAWLALQESLGLNPCLADDMGLGKTIQLIALFLRERQPQPPGAPRLAPTLLIAPTSVLSNWQREVGKFAPNLKCVIHHGSGRPQDGAEFERSIEGADIVATSFSLARLDEDLLKAADWRRVVVDEAQNIKNPRSAQAKAICAIPAPRRIAVTGTPVENRLMDLWSLFNFLNPGYLGTLRQFRRAYETPIQRHSDLRLSRQLQSLVRPFILRRLKTDKSIIRDLPDKVEQKVYCNLTREQASLYQAVVDDVQEQVNDADGIQRRGLILSTLMRLKQICNHPAQFLHDGSAFKESRSHKLTRLNEMIEEALGESDSLLVFTQFTDVGSQLETLLRERHGCPVHYLHGGTSRRRREKMIDSFQDPSSPAGIFILSLKAGGVGITLTRANHVFHFDRWWNPAVENQATDRAYRIGQEKTVFAHKMVVLGTLEERIDEMIESKQALAENIVGADEDWLTEMDNDAFRELIALNRQQIMET